MYIHIYIHIYVYIYIYILHMHVLHAYIHMAIYYCMCSYYTYIYIYILIHIHTHIHTYIHTYTYLAMIKCSICSYQCDIWYVSKLELLFVWAEPHQAGPIRILQEGFGSVRTNNFPVRRGSDCVFRTRRGSVRSVRFGSAPGSGRFWNQRVRFGSVWFLIPSWF